MLPHPIFVAIQQRLIVPWRVTTPLVSGGGPVDVHTYSARQRR